MVPRPIPSADHPPSSTINPSSYINVRSDNDDGSKEEFYNNDRVEVPDQPSNSDFSVGSGKASLQMAQYLDNVESSDMVHDICSFQDVDLNNNAGDEEIGEAISSPRRAQKRYYLLPMLIEYSLPLTGCLAVLLLLVVSIATSVSTTKNRNEAATLAMQQSGGQFSSVSGNASSSSFNSSMEGDGGDFVGDYVAFDDSTGQGEEIVGDPQSFTTGDGQVDLEVSTTSSTQSINSDTVSNSSSTSPHPKWYSTSHQAYQTLLAAHNSTSTNKNSHHTALLFCNNLSQKLCPYSIYCPSGKSHDPYNSGPPNLFSMAQEEWEQWSPVNTNGQGMDWVQVGKVMLGAGDDDNYGRCWRFNEWEKSSSSSGKDITLIVGAEHRQWILCCDV